MSRNMLFLFGEAEKGEIRVPIFCQSLGEVSEHLGNPPEESAGIHLAVQAIMFQWDLLYFRVREEGFSSEDYLEGIRFLKSSPIKTRVAALCMPGVGDNQIIDATHSLCLENKIVLILGHKDLYDYLTSARSDLK